MIVTLTINVDTSPEEEPRDFTNEQLEELYGLLNVFAARVDQEKVGWVEAKFECDEEDWRPER